MWYHCPSVGNGVGDSIFVVKPSDQSSIMPAEVNPISIALFCPKKLLRLKLVLLTHPSSVNADKLFNKGLPKLMCCILVLSKFTAIGMFVGITEPSLTDGQDVFVTEAVGATGDLTRNGVLLTIVMSEVLTVINPEVADAGTVAVNCVGLMKFVVARVSLNRTTELFVKPSPSKVTSCELPLHADIGLKLFKVATRNVATAPDHSEDVLTVPPECACPVLLTMRSNAITLALFPAVEFVVVDEFTVVNEFVIALSE